MILLNFGHPLPAHTLEAIGAVPDLGTPIDGVITVKVHADNDGHFGSQAASILDSVGWPSDQWQKSLFLVILPGLAPMAAALIAEMHGRCGYFPTCVRLKPAPGAIPPQFIFAEFIRLSTVREEARKRR